MTDLSRRAALSVLAASTASVACSRRSSERNSDAPAEAPDSSAEVADVSTGSEAAVREVFSLPQGRPWPTPDPFLFCVHHNDRYPKGNGAFGPAVPLDGRDMGQDFAWKDGWNMYHGRHVPGFPAHPHRGFETVTVVRKGRLDHADSLGAAARYGDGDVQWLTAGSGIQHAEMFPLLKEDEENPLDLFQIWLNLPRRSKMVKPYFSMLWAEKIPQKTFTDPQGKKVSLVVRAGAISGISAPSPPPDSWAADPNNDVGIFTLDFEPGAQWELPALRRGSVRNLYFFSGDSLKVGGRDLASSHGAELDAARAIMIENTGSHAEILILQGKPIGEPVARQGPFVMNTQSEIRQAYTDYRETRFGGWPWGSSDPVHGDDPRRFAKRPDGTTEEPG